MTEKSTTYRPAGRPPSPTFLAVDFFCGAGGTTRGLIDAGGHVLAGIDKDAACRDTYRLNNRNTRLSRRLPEYLNLDIFPASDEHPGGQQEEMIAALDRIVAAGRAEAPGVPLMFAICAPCQPFTNMSKMALTQARADARRRDRNLLTEACRMVERYRPEMVLSENVAGIADPKYGGIWDDFVARLKTLGYTIGHDVVCSSKFGVPQTRRRSILVAVRKDIALPAFDDEFDLPADSGLPTVTVRQAIGDFPPLAAGEFHPSIPNHRAAVLSELNARRLSHAKPGQSNAYLENTPDGDLSLPCHRRAKERTQKRHFGNVYTRIDPDRPGPTITTKAHRISNGRFGHYDEKQVRAISPREAAAIQSFPPNYRFLPETDMEQVAKMIGNAVPPRLSRYFAEFALGRIAS